MYYDLMTAALDAADSIRLSTPAVEALRSLVGLDFRARKAKEKECALAARDYAVRVLSSCGARLASSMFYFVCSSPHLSLSPRLCDKRLCLFSSTRHYVPLYYVPLHSTRILLTV